ncbi:MAG: protein phosphatase [Actinomycetota bacterium]|nr:protein phosphatase [Actinomycetota bacterium]
MSLWHDQLGTIELPDGRRIRGTGLNRLRREVDPPDFAVYLLGRDPGNQGWHYRWVRWRDFGRPASTAEAMAALLEAHERAIDERVEIACRGGIGRTGTALAVIAMMAGTPPDDAVAWVREQYHPRAVETPGQRRWVREAAALL